jgi:hypothetical protein
VSAVSLTDLGVEFNVSDGTRAVLQRLRFHDET